MEFDDSDPDQYSNFALTVRLVPIYTALQNLDTSNKSQEYYAHIAEASRHYRGVIAEIEQEQKDAALQVLNEIWELFEIIMIDSELTGLMKGQTLEDLLMWCSRYNKIPLALQEEALNSPNQFTCDQYYESICGYLLQGNLQAASELLRVHPEYAYGSGTPITKLHQVIVQKPTYSEYTHAPFVEFENAFRIWQSNVDDLIGQGEFDLNPGLERIAGILSGDEATIDGCDKLTGQWYRLLLAKCYYSCPTIDPRTIIHSSASPNSIEHTILADLINRIFELEKGQALRDLVTLSSSWWASAHLADLLLKADTKNEECQKLRNHFVINYANCLLDSPDTWKIGIRYLLSVPFDDEIQNKIDETILSRSIKNNEEAERLYSVTRDLNLPNANYLRKQIATKAAQRMIELDDQGSGLCWAIRANNDEICSEIADSILGKFHRTELWHMPQLIDAIGDANVYSEKLIFLYKYKQFHSKVRDQKTFDAAEDLIALLSCTMSTETLSLVLGQAVVLLDHDFTFSRNHIICIMRALQKQKQKSETLTDAETEQANLLRKALAHHLTRSIIQT